MELIYALPHEQIVLALKVPAGTTIEVAIGLSGILERYPEIAAHPPAVGIFGRRAEISTVLREFDRVEIYRPLIADAKQVRRTRARRAAKLRR